MRINRILHPCRREATMDAMIIMKVNQINKCLMIKLKNRLTLRASTQIKKSTKAALKKKRNNSKTKKRIV